MGRAMTLSDRAAYHRAQRRYRAALLSYDPDRVTHGRASTYTNHRCRCEECKAAHARAQREWRARK